MVWDYLSGVDCVKDIVVPGLRPSVVGLKLGDSEDVGVPASRSPLVARSSGGQATLTDSAGLAYEVFAMTQLVQVQGSPGLQTASATDCRARPEDLAAMARLV